jgi:hypothetical protein
VVKHRPDSAAGPDAALSLLKYLCGLVGASVGPDLRLNGAGENFWTDLTRVASEQLVLTVMAGAVTRLNGLQPDADEAIAFFRQIEETNRQRNTWLLEQLDQAGHALVEAGVPALVMKGGAFLLENRSDAAAWRFFGDLDFLVPADRLDEAVAALKALGYTDRGSVYHPKFHRHYPFLRHPSGETGIDLHTRAAGLHQSVLLDPDHFFADAETVSLAEGEILIPSSTDRLAHLIVNAQVLDYRYQRRLFRLRDVLDFSRLIGREGVDLDDIGRRFKAYGSDRPLLAYLAMMGNVLGPAYQPPPEAAGESRWMNSVRRVIENPRRARLYLLRHWMQMLVEKLFDAEHRQHLFERLLDRDQRAEFIGRRLSHWRIFRR